MSTVTIKSIADLKANGNLHSSEQKLEFVLGNGQPFVVKLGSQAHPLTITEVPDNKGQGKQKVVARPGSDVEVNFMRRFDRWALQAIEKRKGPNTDKFYGTTTNTSLSFKVDAKSLIADQTADNSAIIWKNVFGDQGAKHGVTPTATRKRGRPPSAASSSSAKKPKLDLGSKGCEFDLDSESDHDEGSKGCTFDLDEIVPVKASGSVCQLKVGDKITIRADVKLWDFQINGVPSGGISLGVTHVFRLLSEGGQPPQAARLGCRRHVVSFFFSLFI